MTYRYRPDVLETLAGHGIRPLPTTPPELAREALSNLYRYEIRRLRTRLMRREFPQREYAGRVIELRRKYALLSLPIQLWLQGDA